MRDVLSERKGVAPWLTINRPELRNALNGDVLGALTNAELDANIDKLIAVPTERSPTAIRLGKHAWHAVQDMTLPQCLDCMTLTVDCVMQTDDASGGFASFAEKRKPVWTGR